MIRTFLIAAASTALLALSPMAFAQQAAQFGTADEAKTMLSKAVAAVKADKARALDMFAKGEGGFKDRDLYPFCFNLSDGKVLPFANPNARPLFGQDERTLKDAKEFAFKQAFWDAAQKPEGQVTEVNYVFSKPGTDPTPGGVGYYK